MAKSKTYNGKQNRGHPKGDKWAMLRNSTKSKIHERHWGTCVQACISWIWMELHMIPCKILLPSAVHLEERLTVSPSVPEPASRQSDRYTQFGFFVSGRCGPKQQGGLRQRSKQWPSGNAASRRPCGRRFEPHSGHFGAAGGGGENEHPRIRTDACMSGIGCVTIGPLHVLPTVCVPTACSLLSKNF